MEVPDTNTASAAVRKSSYFRAQEIKMSQIETDIQMYLKSVIALRTQRNECAPISCLPTEIMANIFLHVKRLPNEDGASFWDHTPYRQFPELRWIDVSHVCTLWRNIAINCPRLWTDPPFRHRTWAEETIKRAKNSALDITVDFDANFRSMDVVKGIWPSRGECFRELTLRNAQNPRWHWFWEVAPTSLSRLEKICVNGRSALFPKVLIPIPIFSGASKLREVGLSHCRMDWFLYLPPSITILDLNDVETMPPSTYLQLFNALDGLQSLEVLKLTKSLKTFQDDGCPPHQVNFPKLQKLSIYSSLNEAASFFRFITFPSNVCLDVDTWEERSTLNCAETVKEMFTAIGQSYVHPLSDVPLQTLYVGGSLSLAYDITLSFGIYQDRIESKWNLQAPSFQASISFGEHGSTGQDNILSAIFSSGFPMQDVRVAFLEGLDRSVTPSTLAATLGCLPNLSHVIAESLSVIQLVDSIGHPVGSSMSVYFPNLSVLELHEVPFDLEHNGYSVLFESMQRSLSFRKACKNGLTKLLLRNCYQMDSEMVELLRAEVVDVDWDGVKRGFSSDSEEE